MVYYCPKCANGYDSPAAVLKHMKITHDVNVQKPFDCMTCDHQIKISKIDNAGPDAKNKKWEKYELDGKTPHMCNNKKNKQQQPSSDVSKEVAAVKAKLPVLVSRLDHIEQELQTHVS